MGYSKKELKQLILKVAYENGLRQLIIDVGEKGFSEILKNPFNRSILIDKIRYSIEQELLTQVSICINVMLDNIFNKTNLREKIINRIEKENRNK